MRTLVVRWMSRWFRPSARLASMHAAVLQRFPHTPWVYGGCWSWFSTRFRFVLDVLVYPYLPLVLIDRESVPADVYQDLMRSCAFYSIPVVDVSDGDEGLMRALDRLEERAGG